MAATAEHPHGSVTFLPENEELAAEETVEIVYSPPRELFRDSDTLLYCGGFNGWDGEDEAITLPMIPIEDGKFRVSINIPNFARVRMRSADAIMTPTCCKGKPIRIISFTASHATPPRTCNGWLRLTG